MSEKLCELPEVFDLVKALMLLLDHAGDDLPHCLIDRDTMKITTYRDLAAKAVRALGFKAEWKDAKHGRRKFKGLHVTFPSKAAAARFKKGYAARAK